MNIRGQLKVVCLCAVLGLMPPVWTFAGEVVPSATISEAGFGSHTAPAKKTGGGIDQKLFVTLNAGESKPLFDWLIKAKKGSLKLYVDGVLLKGISGDWYPAKSLSALQFELVRNNDNRDQWGKLLGASWSNGKTVSITIGTEDRSFVADSDKTIHLDPRIRETRGWLLMVVAVLLVMIAFAVAFMTTLLRDKVVPGNTPPVAPKDAPFSLGRTQMFWWSVQVLFAFLAISAMTGATDTITPTMLVLMGISAGTAAGSVTINQTIPTRPSEKCFFKDIIYDQNGPSLHRLQMASWTVVLTCIFWVSVWEKLAMPEFDSTLLTLMGISSGTYFGFKFQER